MSKQYSNNKFASKESPDFSYNEINYSRNDLQFFSEPESLSALTKFVLPKLKLKDSAKIWLPFCESGQDAYTLSIILYENKVNKAMQILAGEDNENKLMHALQGKYPKDDILRARRNYFFSGGKSELLEYFVYDGDEATLKSEIRNKVLFSSNKKINSSDSDLIYIPNLLSRMDVLSQKKLLNFLKFNLAPEGFLVLGTYDSLSFSESIDEFEKIDKEFNIWKKL